MYDGYFLFWLSIYFTYCTKDIDLLQVVRQLFHVLLLMTPSQTKDLQQKTTKFSDLMKMS